MPYFARINKKTNIVEEVISSTQLGIFEKHDFEDWIQTSYNGNMRKNYAGIGYVYDKVRDAFIPPKPFPSWVLNEDNLLWNPPVPYSGEDMMSVVWDEDAYQADNTQGWVLETREAPAE